MKAIMTIFKKELKGFVFSPGFLLICGITTAILSLKYFEGLYLFAESLNNRMMMGGVNQKAMNIHYGVFFGHLSILNLILIFAVPALTMKLLSEEKKMKTYDLLLTLPVTSAQIVIGKFLAGLFSLLAIISLALLYPAFNRMFAEFSWPMLIVAFLGIFLVASFYVAMNLFCSALTESAIVAFVLAVILNVSVWLVGSAVQVVDSSTARQVFEHISLSQHMSSLIEGTIRTSSLIFFLSVIAFFVFLTERVVEASRWR